ncbi:tetratricopeptide repeat protein [Lentzea alba]|uniref:AfsR/SARP family transcriptional regulator n=1 Tax=Lentzea alba TaxID=2714351 RepID=UPI0039BEF2EC
MLRLLGEVAGFADGKRVDLGPPKQRCVLAVLAVEAGRVVPVERLVDRVWGERAPRRGRETVHSYVSRLRSALSGCGVDLVHRSGGYVLFGQVDLQAFRDLCAKGRADESVAVSAFTEAMALWRGEALTGLDNEWVRAERELLELERAAAEHDLTGARLRAGEGRELVADLYERAGKRPLDEAVHGQYLLALHQAGRTGDALEHYRNFRARLVDELGAEPGAALRDLHQQILTADPRLTATPPTSRVPRQLPAAPTPFIGRLDALRSLDALLDTTDTVVISAVSGTGGMGKTSLALHWAHSHADRFPDGHLFVDLRGFSPAGQPMRAQDALLGFVHALGVAPAEIPDEQEARAALFRTLVSDRRMLLVLDNAADTDQVVPLLPGSRSCTVVVTSRNQLPGLVARFSADHLPLDTLDVTEARALLRARLGAERVEAEQAAAEGLISLCDGFPLALNIIAAQARTRPSLSLATLENELRAGDLDVLDTGEPSASLPAVLSWSLRALTAADRGVFALLGVAPGPSIGLATAASLTAVPEIRRVLQSLEAASLLIRDGHDRYRMHDLVRAYAGNVARELPEHVVDTALRRAIDHYVHTAHASDLHLEPHRERLRFDPPAAGVRPEPIAGYTAAMDWFDAEHACLLAAQQLALAQGWHESVRQLAWATDTYHHRRGHRHARLDVWQAAELSDPLPHAVTQAFLGRAHTVLGNHDEALDHLHRALAMDASAAQTHFMLARAQAARGDDKAALDHAQQALELHRGRGQPAREARAASEVGWYAAQLGEYDMARDHYREALEMFRRQHDPSGVTAALYGLGYVEHHSGEHQEAVGHYREALALCRELGNAHAAADTLTKLGHPLVAIGEREQARGVWEQALLQYQQAGLDNRAADVRRLLDEV